MKYVKADDIFPLDLLKEIQLYISDGLVYFPASKEKRKSWGEVSGEKNRLEIRNNEIKSLFKKQQMSIESLAAQYNLSLGTIKNIVYSN